MKPQHVEFLDKDHFEKKYHRVAPSNSLLHFIDFFWETRFDDLWDKHPQGFSDVLFPNIGYTYLINLGTPFVMQLDDEKFEVKKDGFLPRHKNIECHHSQGNQIFGIKFKISPVLFEKKINFSEYKEYIFPLSYLVDESLIKNLKKAPDFNARVKLATTYYQSIVEKKSSAMHSIIVVREILDHCNQHNLFNISVDSLAANYQVSSRTLQRYFETCIGISGKTALQIMRIRKAVTHLSNDPTSFHYSNYGYYDHSHFFKHLKQFMQKSKFHVRQPHLQLLEGLHKQPLNAPLQPGSPF